MQDLGKRTLEIWYTEIEMAELLQISPMTVRRLRESGKLGYYRIGNGIRISQLHLTEMLAANEHYGRHQNKKSSGKE